MLRSIAPKTAVILLPLAFIVMQCSDSLTTDIVNPPDNDSTAILADHSSTAAFAEIPSGVLELVRDSLVIFYGHTSHGSQLLTGVGMLAAEDAQYEGPSIEEYGDDLGGSGDTSWAAEMRARLNNNTDINVMMWSWCGGCSENTEAGIDAYLAALSDLEADYPDVAFVYMTGHLDGTGPDGNLYARNNQIRAFCAAHGKILFDFADIESYDPAGTYYPDETDACAWCQTWCAGHTCASCDGCAHSECFNCYRKGQAFWWMMARLVGWNG